MRIYKVQFESDDFKYSYLVDVEVLGRNREDAVRMACEQAETFCDGSARLSSIEEGKRRLFGKPGIVNIKGGAFQSRKHDFKVHLA